MLNFEQNKFRQFLKALGSAVELLRNAVQWRLAEGHSIDDMQWSSAQAEGHSIEA